MGPAGGAVVRRPVDRDALALGDLADDQPALGHRGPVGEGRQQRVVVAAAEDEAERVGAQRRAHGGERLGDLERAAAHVDRDPALAGQVAGLGEQPVGDVDHRGGAGLGGDLARRRTAARDGGRPRPARAASGTRDPARPVPRRPSPGGRASASTSPGAAPLRTTGAWVHAPMTVTAMTTSSARVTSPPTTLAPTSAASAAKPAGEVERPLHRQVGGHGHADGERVGATAHGVDVGEVLGGRPVADVLGAGPVAAEVPALHHQVGGDDHVAVADAQHRGVVAGPDQHVLALREDALELLDQAELTGIGDGRVGRVRRLGKTCLPSHQTTR